MFFRKFLAFILSVVFLLVSTSLAIVFSIYNFFTDADLYRQTLVEVVYDLVTNELPKRAAGLQENIFEEEEIRGVLDKVLVEDDFRVVLDSLGSQMRNVVSTDKKVKIKIPTLWVKEKGDVLSAELAPLIYKKMSSCKDFIKNGGKLTGGKFQCIPNNFSEADLKSEIKKQFDVSIMSKVPDELALEMTIPVEFNGDLVAFINNWFLVIFAVGLAGLAVLLAIIGLLIFSPAWLVIKWEMRTILKPAFVICLLFGSILYSTRFIDGLNHPFFAQFDATSVSIFKNSVKSLLEAFSVKQLYYFGPVFIVSFAGWIYATILCRRVGKK
ncbi:MAG: hypothetical protein AAB540_03060 [Patescibacteria group bacterium]